jgi:hypothetical protein
MVSWGLSLIVLGVEEGSCTASHAIEVVYYGLSQKMNADMRIQLLEKILREESNKSGTAFVNACVDQCDSQVDG